ncbi:hypothetical protein [Streptomyces sp. TRM70350]|uniref:hypothetical protein n=1 Tax=Streptomyces sp. TRM70350 TaxID=2856165 RepID=UPI001C43BD2B|nr:hypothetical protein [Streptomyces sp. TRM70350]MBV7699296.1 hypothetical protein [Streptomyces sp. TRM70350]
MFSTKKIAAVSGLLGGLAVTCTGVTQAYAAAGPGACTRDAEGNITCIQWVTGHPAEGERAIAKQSQNCVPVQPLTLPAPFALLSRGSTKIGPEVTCDSSTPDTSDSGDTPVLSRLLG